MDQFEQKYRINSLVLNSSGRLGLFAFLNLLQDCAWEHAHQIGHGYADTLQKKAFWVLTRQKIKMSRWPTWGENIHIQTWIREPSAGVIRDFLCLDDQGNILGEATTGWLLLDSQTRRPFKEDLKNWIDPRFVAAQSVSIQPEKIQTRDRFESLASFEVRNSDLDVNKHVNNTKYAQWVLDAIPREWHSRFQLLEYDINFLAETHLKDVVRIEQQFDGLEEDELKDSFFRGVRESDQKVVFTAKTKSRDLNV